jgi:hypothetical protein
MRALAVTRDPARSPRKRVLILCILMLVLICTYAVSVNFVSLSGSKGSGSTAVDAGMDMSSKCIDMGP